jgi:hypothetical protein
MQSRKDIGMEIFRTQEIHTETKRALEQEDTQILLVKVIEIAKRILGSSRTSCRLETNIQSKRRVKKYC